jgi:hypothetical protein
MVQPQVTDGGDGLQIWWVAVNILHKQSQTVDRVRSSSLEVGQGANDPHHKKKKLRNITYSLRPGRIL